MKEIRDYRNRKVGEYNPDSGQIISRFGKDSFNCVLTVGTEFIITHAGISTAIKRITNSDYIIYTK